MLIAGLRRPDRIQAICAVQYLVNVLEKIKAPYSMEQQSRPGGPPAPQKPTPARPRPTTFWLVLPLIVAFVLATFYFSDQHSGRSRIPYGFFLEQLKAGNIAEAHAMAPRFAARFRKFPRSLKKKQASPNRLTRCKRNSTRM